MPKIIAIPDHIKERVFDEVERCLNVAEREYGQSFEFPIIEFTLRGRTAGYAYCDENRINLNSVLLMENLDSFIDGRDGRGTVTHEVAHLVDYIVHNGFKRRGKRGGSDVHGERWKKVMRLFGVKNPSRCHSYDTSNSRVRKSVKHEYRCNGCGEILKLGPKQHKKQQNPTHQLAAKRKGSRTVYWKRQCKVHARVHGYTYLGPDNRPRNSEQAAQLRKENPLPRHGTKLEHAVEIVRENSHKDKEIVISRILNAYNMSYQGAQTYYYKARKIAEVN